MVCIICGHETSVVNSRPSKRTPAIWRRRTCANCSAVFSTREKPDLSLSIRVRRKASDLQPFSEDKLLLSIYNCLSHRKDALTASTELKTTSIIKLLPVSSGILSTQEIAAATYRVLLRFDKTAATIYKAHHLKS